MGRVSSHHRAVLIDGKTVLAIIPARGGSKRIPKKNSLPLLGKPLVVWSIEAGIKSKYIDKVIVSSDCENILNISSKAGTEIIERPKELATDTATTFSAIEHLTKVTHFNYEFIILLQPTSPIRNSKHIDDAFELLIEKKADAIISVTEPSHSPLWANTIPNNLSLKNFINPRYLGVRSQELPNYYRPNGAIFICNKHQLLKEKTFFIKNNIYAFIMSKEDSIDVDTEIDLRLAEIILGRTIK